MAMISRERSIANNKHFPFPALLIWCYCCCMLVATLNVVSAKESDVALDSKFAYPAPVPSDAVSTTTVPQVPSSLSSPAEMQDPNIHTSPGSSILGSAVPGTASIDLLTPTPSPTLNRAVSPDVSSLSTPSSSTSTPPVATEPIFPPKSVSCQQCKYFYRMQPDCEPDSVVDPFVATDSSTNLHLNTKSISIQYHKHNIIIVGSRNATINAPGSASSSSSKATLGWYGYSPESMSPFLSMSKLLSNPGASTATSAVSDPSINGSTTNRGNGSGNGGSIGDSSLDGSGSAGVNFTALLPFLQCICPNQGLAASRVCMTCFRVSDQPNYLSELKEQNVTSSLSVFAQACADSGDGRYLTRSADNPGSSTNEGNSMKSRRHGIIEVLFSSILLVIFLEVE
ncbi:hypothetical protein EDD21DRAFT_365241 [Dissophora ornata]|nr:hypothetical protein EDD21DRAFT_365241 [Dissophora ornata]